MKRLIRSMLNRPSASRRRADGVRVQPLESRVLFAAGDLDTTFGGDGKVTTDFPGVRNVAADAELHSDGKVLIAGSTGGFTFGSDFLLARVNPSDGSLDTSFGGGDGFVMTDFGSTGEQANDVLVLPGGKILVVGATRIVGFDGDAAIAMARYNPDGSLDATFGGGDGRVVYRGANARDIANAAVVLPDGKIMVAGFSQNNPRLGSLEEPDFLLARFNADGSPDLSFGGGDARVTTDVRGFDADDIADAIALLPDGDVLVGGSTYNYDVMVRYNPDGTIDPSFHHTPNTGPQSPTEEVPPGAVFTYGSDVLVVTGGKILSGGIDTLARYNLDGTFDTSSGRSLRRPVEVRDTRFGGTDRVIIRDVDVLPGGDYLVTGRNDSAGGTAVVRLSPSFEVVDDADVWPLGPGEAAVPLPGGGFLTVGENDVDTFRNPELLDVGMARLTDGLELDPRFGESSPPFPLVPGTAVLDFGDRETASAVAAAPGGKFVVAGTTTAHGGGPVIARYNADGTLDAGFGRDGRVTARTAGIALDTIEAVAARPDGSVLVAGSLRGDFGVARYTAEGALDTGFGAAGVRKINFAAPDDTALAIAVMADGRIVVAGRGSTNFGFVRLLPNGSLDPTFDRDGQRTLDLGGADDAATSVAVLPDGRIVAGGVSKGDFAVARLRADGSPDPTFSGDGKATVDMGGTDAARAVAVVDGGKVLVAGNGGPIGSAELGSDFAVARFNANGSIDTSFSGDGEVLTHLGGLERGEALALLPGGRFAVVGTRRGAPDDAAAGVFADRDFAVAVYRSDGSPDTSFGGGDGIVTTDFFGRSADDAFAALLTGDRLLVVGQSDGDFALARYLTAGGEQPPPEEIVVQAEDATLSGAVVARSNAGFTGTGYADYVNNTGDFVEWTVNVPSAGRYSLQFRYANGSASDRPLTLTVNGGAPRTLSFGPTGSWTRWNMASAPADLAAGANRIRLTAAGRSGPNIDALTVRPATTVGQPREAESAVLSGAVAASSHPGFTGTGYADYVNNSGDYVEWGLAGLPPGDYRLTFRYANGSTSNRPLELREVRPGAVPATLATLAFAPTGSWSTWRTASVVVRLSAPAVSSLRAVAIGLSGPNLDSLTIEPAPVP